MTAHIIWHISLFVQLEMLLRRGAPISFYCWSRRRLSHYVFIYHYNIYIFRVLWCAAVISAIIFFTYQLGNRLHVYFEYQSTVSVEMKFTDSMEFPAVTLCNQNSFRYITTSSFCFRYYKNQITSEFPNQSN